MQSRDFVFWLQGFFELTDPNNLTNEQVQLIKAHLDLVFKHDVSIKRKEMEHYTSVPAKPYIPSGPVITPTWDPYYVPGYNPKDLMIATC